MIKTQRKSLVDGPLPRPPPPHTAREPPSRSRSIAGAAFVDVLLLLQLLLLMSPGISGPAGSPLASLQQTTAQ